MESRYKRVLLKLSGEVLAGGEHFGLDYDAIRDMSRQIVEVAQQGIQVAMVVGGGNIIRGAQTVQIERAQADYMGMLGTVINALALQDALERLGQPTRVQCAIEMKQIAETVIRRRAIRHLEKGRIVIFAAGSGNPFFTTDTAAALRGAEVGAQIMLKATKVDGVYTADPNKDASATRYASLSFDEAISKNLQVLDATAFALCRDQKLPIKVFSIFKPGALKRVVMGEDEGTLVHS